MRGTNFDQGRAGRVCSRTLPARRRAPDPHHGAFVQWQARL